MSTAKEKLNKIAKLLGLEFEDQPAPSAPAGQTCTLPDGRTMTCVPGCEVGADCTIDGQPAPDGEYPCADGTTCVVVGGKITEVRPAAQAPADEPVTMSDEEKKAIHKLLESKVADMLSKFSEEEVAPLKAENESLKAELETQKQAFAAQAEATKALLDLVKELSAEPVAPATEPVKNHFASQKPSKETRMAELAQTLSKIIKNKNS